MYRGQRPGGKYTPRRGTNFDLTTRFRSLIIPQDSRVAGALQHLAEVLQKVVENNDAQLLGMGSMLRNFAETSHRLRESEHGDKGSQRAPKGKGKYAISLTLKV